MAPQTQCCGQGRERGEQSSLSCVSVGPGSRLGWSRVQALLPSRGAGGGTRGMGCWAHSCRAAACSRLPWAETRVQVHRQPQRAFHLFNLHLCFCFVVLSFSFERDVTERPQRATREQTQAGVQFWSSPLLLPGPAQLPPRLPPHGDGRGLRRAGWLFGDKL